MSTLQNVQNSLSAPSNGDADAARLEKERTTHAARLSEHHHDEASLVVRHVPFIELPLEERPDTENKNKPPPKQTPAGAVAHTEVTVKKVETVDQVAAQKATAKLKVDAQSGPEQLTAAFLEDHQRLLQLWMNRKSKGQSYLDDPIARNIYFQHSQTDGRIAEYYALRHMLGEATEAHANYAALIEADNVRVRHDWNTNKPEGVTGFAHDPKLLSSYRKLMSEVGQYLARYIMMQRVLDDAAVASQNTPPSDEATAIDAAEQKQLVMSQPKEAAQRTPDIETAPNPEDLTAAFLEDHQRLLQLWATTKSEGERYLDHPEASKIYFEHAHRDGRIAEYYALRHLLSEHGEASRTDYAALLEADIQNVRAAWSAKNPNGVAGFAHDPVLIKSYRKALTEVGSYIATYQTMRLALEQFESSAAEMPE